MRHIMGLVLAGALILGTASHSGAQVAVSIGNPYAGQGLYVGNPGFGYGNTGYNYGYPGAFGYGVPTYSYGYNNFSNTTYLAGPGTFSYSSGYRGFVPPVSPYGYRARPYYGAYGYGGYGYGPRYGYRPFLGGWRFR